MANRPSTPEIITVNSEELQTQIRNLLPSQNGFGSELQASNVITPIIDLTSAAEGSGLPDYLQNALAFGSQTEFAAENNTVTLVASPGFYRVTGVSVVVTATGSVETKFEISNGFATKEIWTHFAPGVTTTGSATAAELDLVMFLRAGDTLTATSSSTDARIQGSFRQIATGDGTLVQPNGFPL